MSLPKHDTSQVEVSFVDAPIRALDGSTEVELCSTEAPLFECSGTEEGMVIGIFRGEARSPSIPSNGVLKVTFAFE
jgi:hypothetical protein